MLSDFIGVTTFHRGGYQEYAHRMLASFGSLWPTGVPIYVYAEGLKYYEVPLPPHFVFRDLEAGLPGTEWLAAFKRRHSGHKPSSYRMDVVRFAHKIAAVMAAVREAKHVGARYVIWLDADLVMHNPLTVDDLRGLTPDGAWISYLRRKTMYSECGWYMIDTKHPDHEKCMVSLWHMYAGDRFSVQKEWHDSYLLDRVVEACSTYRSISGDGENTTHPLINGPLGRWFDHAKGKRKKAGRSSAKTDLVKPREEEYWR